MSVFTRKQIRNWKVQFNSTDVNRKRLDSINERLKHSGSDSIFDINGLLEKDLENHLLKAEKELDKLEKELNKGI